MSVIIEFAGASRPQRWWPTNENAFLIGRDPVKPFLAIADGAEITRQMRERGSVSALRGYKPENQADIIIESVGNGCHLLQPRSAKGRVLIQELLADTTHLFFGNELVIRDREAMLLIKAAKRHDVKIQIACYMEGLC
jgi:hypothetical protein